jgi:hypothetical protein
VLLNGTWADQVLYPFPPGYYVDAVRAGQWAQLYSHVRGLPDWFVDVPRSALWRAVGRHLLRAHLPAAVPRLLQRWRGSAGLARLLDVRLQESARAAQAPVAPWSDNRSAHARAVELHVRSRLDTLTLEWYAKAAVRQGVQAGLPFLDRELLTLLITAPGLAQTTGGTPKALLRASMKAIVPTAILERRSKGDYTVLIQAPLRDYAPLVFDELRTGRVRDSGLLSAQAFAGDLALFSRRAHIGASDAALALASLFAVECWLRRFCES